MKRIITICFLACLTGMSVQSQELTSSQPVSREIGKSLRLEAASAINRAMDWLKEKQKDDGSWSNPVFPALTGLPVWALAGQPAANAEAIERGVAFILSCTHPSGAIYREPEEERKGGGLSNYNTAICMTALNAVNHPELTAVILRARRFMEENQHLGNDIYYGGMGYDPSTGRAYADLSNSYITYEAMALTEHLEEQRPEGEQKADLDWEAAEKFVSRVQNLPESNDMGWTTHAESEKGGFAYKPDESKAGTFTDEEGNVKFRSYGSMTYAGLLSFIYADVDRDDFRVRAAFDWARNNWTLEENPGMGNQGLFYFYNVLSKGLAAFGHDVIAVNEGSKVNWREEFLSHIISLQKIDADTGHGYWVNEQGRWWESDPVLVTAYSIIAMQVALGD